MKIVAFGLSLFYILVWAVKTNGDQLSFWSYVIAALMLPLLLFRAFTGLYAYVEHDAIEPTMLEEFLEKFKTIMRIGNDTLGIPVLDPFIADEIGPILIDDEMIRLDALLTNVKVDGLSTYNVNHGDFQIIGMKLVMNLSWPLIIASTNYAMKGKADNFEIYGNGKMEISPQDFFFETEIGFTMNGKYLKVRSMELKLFLKALNFHATGLFDDDELSELLSAVISDMMPQLIEDYHDTITGKLIPLVTQKLDAFLSTMTLAELLKLIGL
ncbi:uncharacterized protein [Polyergus mexicanus]|uniref:uncharacterized protein isoform X2 n=1 Tax=Polyergus mexicanus TaxID=615972 RepID=UPI0038B52227